MSHLKHIQTRTESSIETSINELKALLNSVKIDLQLSPREKVHKVAIITANLKAQEELKSYYSILLNDVPVEF